MNFDLNSEFCLCGLAVVWSDKNVTVVYFCTYLWTYRVGCATWVGVSVFFFFFGGGGELGVDVLRGACD